MIMPWDAVGSYWQYVNIVLGDGLVQSVIKQLLEPMLPHTSVAFSVIVGPQLVKCHAFKGIPHIKDSKIP